jgi:hypothetical protein
MPGCGVVQWWSELTTPLFVASHFLMHVLLPVSPHRIPRPGKELLRNVTFLDLDPHLHFGQRPVCEDVKKGNLQSSTLHAHLISEALVFGSCRMHEAFGGKLD